MRRIQFIILLLTVISLACEISQITSLIPTQPSSSEVPTNTEPAPLSKTELTFHVQIPANTPINQPVSLSILEEVTGLALSARSYTMNQEDDQHYSLTMPFTIGTLVKYRYTRQGPTAPLMEHISNGQQVRYRMYYVEAPGTVQDVISRWTDTEFQEPSGRISGQVIDASTGQPIPNLFVTAGGNQVLTTSDGSFLIEGLPPGTHNLVGAALDGSYRTFQQGALISAGSTTPAQLLLKPASMVDVDFILKVPQNTIPAVPIRIAGNLYQFGNTFADLAGGISTIASRMPILNLLPDGRYTLKMSLPTGADIHYLYTLGDGIWNTELNENGKTNIRQMIVPESSITIEDTIESWLAENSSPITFDVIVPNTTPPEDYVSIQFNPLYGWTEAIPMWHIGEDRWGFILNSPLNLTDSIHYRFCRNDQCGSADDIATTGNNTAGFPVSSSLFEQSVVENVDSWAWINPELGAIPEIPAEVKPRSSDFFAGVELLPAYHPSWLPLLPNSLNDIQLSGGNWIVFAPTWTYTRLSPPILEQVTGQDPLWMDLIKSIETGHEQGFNLAIMPTARFLIPEEEWWSTTPRDFSWWQVWFERYRSFALHHADLAARSGAQVLILGGDWVNPALPDGIISKDAPSGVPIDSEARWRTLLQEVKSHYNGPLFWALDYSQASHNPPTFLDLVDGIYLLWSEPLATPEKPNPSPAEMQSTAGRLLDSGILPLKTKFNKPVILAVAYPSADGIASGCIPDADGACIDINLLSPIYPDIPVVQLDLQEQVDLYNATMAAISQRDWISGCIARGYYPPAILQDKSASIHGKPTEQLLASWFLALLPESSSAP